MALPFRRTVAEPYRPIPWVYFPETGVFSVTVDLVDGSSIEVNLVGREGFTSVAAFVGVTAPLRVTTLVAGTFLRMRASAFADAAQRDRLLLDRTHRYIQALLSVRALSVGCDRVHAVRPRLARWLLKTHDRVGVDEFRLTQDVVALMLGVARPSVTVNALFLEREGMIEYHRGHIRILDRPGLEGVACECYGAVRNEFERLLGWTIG